jgi:hypothetical protein
VGTRKASESEPLLTCRNSKNDIKTGATPLAPGQAWRVSAYWPGGVRHAGGASLVCGFRAELGKACVDTVARTVRRFRDDERERAEQQKLRGFEYRRGACWRTGL